MKFFSALCSVLLCSAAFGTIGVEVKGGAPVNLDGSMYYWVKGMKEVGRIQGQYYTEPFKEAPYYIIRFNYTQESKNRWEIELIHHKVYVKNPPTDTFQSVNISHGYNFILLNRAFEEKYFTWRVGAGVILTHPEIVMRDGSKVPWVEGALVGFYVSGFGLQAAIERRFFVYNNLFVCPEVKLTVGQAQVGVVDGWVNLPNIAFHATVGLGYEF